MLSKKLLVPIFAIVIASGTLFTVSTFAQAQSGNNPLSGLAQAIAQKFNLNQSDVQSVISGYMQQNRQTMQQNMQQRVKNILDQEVQQGKLTSTQEQAILTELANLQTKYNPQSLKSMTLDQRKQAIQNRQSDLKTWAASQGIDITLIPGFGMGMHQGRFWHSPTVTPTP